MGEITCVGSDILDLFIEIYGFSSLNQDYNEQVMVDFFYKKTGDFDVSNLFIKLFEKLKATSPILITTNFLFLWWINFTCRWQGVSVRPIVKISDFCLRTIDKKLEYLDKNMICFYNTDNFQLWSLNNPDKRIKDSWSTYKYICKDIIYDFDKDEDYRDNKLKIGSLKNYALPRRLLFY
jgi:hypothetical protein